MQQHDLNELAVKAQNKLIEALNASQERYERLLSNTSGLFAFRYNTQGVFEYVSPNIKDMLGYTPDDFCTHYSHLLSDDPINADADALIKQSFAKNKHHSFVIAMRHKHAEQRLLHINTYPVFDECGQQVIAVEGFANDITMLKQMEKELRHSQKMAALGTLSGGIAHNFNNLLAGIKGNVFLAQRKHEHAQDPSDNLTAIDQLCDRSSKLIRQLLTFARAHEPKKEHFIFNTLVQESIDTFTIASLKNIELCTYLCPEPLNIYGDAAELQQVIINLLNNAKDALEGRQQARISIHLQASHSVQNKQPPMAQLSIEDNGSGISEQQKERIFEPFFTTKDPSRGTGLGLSTSIGTIKAHHGHLQLESRLGQGSKFTIQLPLDK